MRKESLPVERPVVEPSKTKGRVIIYLEGGLIQGIKSCDQSLEIIVHDSDETDDSSDEKMTRIDGELVYLAKWDADPDPESIPTYIKLKAAIDQETQETSTTEKEMETFTCPTCRQEVNNLCDACGVCGKCCECLLVSLLVSGYEWTCPICNKNNYTTAVVEEVTCQECGKTYHVDMAGHAYD